MSKPRKIVLAFSGGLDTSVILKWLQIEYGAEIVTFTADLGQGEELEIARKGPWRLASSLRTFTSRTFGTNWSGTTPSRCTAETPRTSGTT